MTTKHNPTIAIPDSTEPTTSDRLNRAKDLMTGDGEDVSKNTKTDKTTKSVKSERKHRASVRYMQQHGIKNVDDLKYLRLNCDIPKELHTWLFAFARSSSEYSSVTEIVIDKLGELAKEHGFKVKK